MDIISISNPHATRKLPHVRLRMRCFEFPRNRSRKPWTGVAEEIQPVGELLSIMDFKWHGVPKMAEITVIRDVDTLDERSDLLPDVTALDPFQKRPVSQVS